VRFPRLKARKEVNSPPRIGGDKSSLANYPALLLSVSVCEAGDSLFSQ